ISLFSWNISVAVRKFNSESLSLSRRASFGFQQSPSIRWAQLRHFGHQVLILLVLISLRGPPHQRKQRLGLYSAFNLLVLPFLLKNGNRREEINCPANAATIMRLETPEIDANASSERRQQREAI